MNEKAVLFFPASSIRTRVTFEKGVYLLGGQPILFPTDAMDMANQNAVLNPCPPFCRGEEVSDDVIESGYFAGYEFKKNLLTVQQAVMIWCMLNQR